MGLLLLLLLLLLRFACMPSAQCTLCLVRTHANVRRSPCRSRVPPRFPLPPRRVVLTVIFVLEGSVGGHILKSGLRVLATTSAGLLGVG